MAGIGIGAIAILVEMRIVAGMDIPVLSIIIRTWWNLSFKLAAFIPFCGWMSHLIIVKKGDKAAEAEKEHFVNIGRETDNATSDMFERSAARAKAEQEAYELQRQQEEANRKALEEDLRARAGTSDLHLNSDGSKARVGDSDFIPTEELKKNL